MAILKDLIVNGVSRFIGKIYASGGIVGDLEGTASNASKVNNHTVESNVPSDAKFTDTWRGIQDNLTSDSTTESLSAKQGKVLKDLVDGKASSSHTHDDRYYTESEIDSKLNGKLSISGGTMTGAIQTSSDIVRNVATNNSTNFYGGSSFNDGASIFLRGKDQKDVNGVSIGGRFEINASDGSTCAALIGLPNGSLSYTGKDVVFNNQDVLNLSKQMRIDSDQGIISAHVDSEGGNIRLAKKTSNGLNPYVEIDTCVMNGVDGNARFYIGTSESELTTSFKFCENGDFQNGQNVSMNDLNSRLNLITNLRTYFVDTVADNIQDCLSKKCVHVRNDFNAYNVSCGAFIMYGGWSGHNYGVFVGQCCNNNVHGLFISDSLYRAVLEPGSTDCIYKEY